jgi:hypothetical protein
MQHHDHLHCQICSELYTAEGSFEPRILNCGHTICLRCLTFLICSSLHNCCPFCKSLFHEQRRNFPKNYALIDVLNGAATTFGPNDDDDGNEENNGGQDRDICNDDDNEECSEKYSQSQTSFDMNEVNRLKEQARLVCSYERMTLFQYSKYSEQFLALEQLEEAQRMKFLKKIQKETLLCHRQSQKRLEKYEYLVSLLESIDPLTTNQIIQLIEPMSFAPIQHKPSFSSLPYHSDLTPIARRPDLPILMQQIRCSPLLCSF